jgi:hypothetical protein
LRPASPCINAGNNSYITTATDKDGKPRIINGAVDMGPYEFGIPTIITTHITDYSPTPSGFRIDWNPMAGYDSRITFSTDLTLPFSNLSTTLPYPVNSYVDTAYGAKNKCYYKVDLVPKP